MTDLTEQIEKRIDYYQSHAPLDHLPIEKRKIKKIILTGRGANLKGLKEYLSQRLKLEVEIAHPLSNIQDSPISLQESLGYSTAIGLALRGFQENYD